MEIIMSIPIYVSTEELPVSFGALYRVLAQTGARHYIKIDLRPFLPSGYSNPMRISQHH